MRKRTLLLGCLVLCSAAPAPAAVYVYRATGAVNAVIGNASLLPIPAEVGDDFTIELTFDDTTADTNPDPNFGGYPTIAFAVTIDGTTVEFGDAPSGTSGVSIQRTGGFDLFGISACLACEPGVTTDEARINFYYPAATLASDALEFPLDANGTTSVQFGLFSSQSPPLSEAGVEATLATIELVPEPGAALLLTTGALALAARRRAAPRRQRASAARPPPAPGAA